MNEATIAKIATEALKPFSSIIDSLLGPKLKRIRNWSERADLKGRLKSNQVEIIMIQYLRRLLRRICGITTIVFPQQVLSLTSIYEPLWLEERYRMRTHKKTNLKLQLIQEGQNSLIVDSAGMGKSTFAKHYILEILCTTKKVPIFLELRRVSESETLFGKIATEIDETQNEIDEKLLMMLFDLGNFVILLDGYDEVPDQLRSKIGEQITELAIRCECNSLIVTSRPEVVLPELPHSKVFSIRPLTIEQAKSLVLRYDAFANIDVGKCLINEFSTVPKRFLETPLLVALLYRTYGFNSSIATRISTFYDEIYNAFYKGHDLTKSGFARPKTCQLDAEDFRRLLRCFSFLLLVHQITNIKSKTEGIMIIDEAIRFCSVKPTSPPSFFEDLLLAVPFITKEGTDFRFIHKSIGEFFAAEFLAYHINPEQIIEHIRHSQLSPSFINSFEYLSDINPTLFRRIIAAPLARMILDQVDPIQDSLVRTICYHSPTYLGLWPYNKYVKTEKNERGKVVLPDINRYSTCFFYYGTLSNEKYLLSIATNSIPDTKYPIAAWKLVTTELNRRDDSCFRSPHSDFTFDGIDIDPINEQWASLENQQVLDTLSNHSAIRRALINFFIGRSGINNDSKPNTNIRVIDENACKELLAQVQQEEEAQQWLTEMISGRKKTNEQMGSDQTKCLKQQ